MLVYIRYDFSATTWQSSFVVGAWHFVSLPLALSKEIREAFQHQEEGWGRLKTTAKIGATEWKTAIWFDSKSSTYLLPLKADIRKKENIEVGQLLNVSIWI
jgi:hypothetical protein